MGFPLELAAITPVGPGHELAVKDCKEAMQRAFDYAASKGWRLRHIVVDDTQGKLGRSRARNEGMRRAPIADWYFFVDADDLAFEKSIDWLINTVASGSGIKALFGPVWWNGRRSPADIFPLHLNHILRHGSVGTLSMGAFFAGPEARELRFSEELDAGEDFEFYLQFISRHKWLKGNRPLVDIKGGNHKASASGPRGYHKIRWGDVCAEVVRPWRRRKWKPMTEGERQACVAELRTTLERFLTRPVSA